MPSLRCSSRASLHQPLRPGYHSDNADMVCLTCRSRKVKCDERRPKCRNCERTRVQCIPSDRFSFKHWRNPSGGDSAKRGGSGNFRPGHVWVDIVPSYRFVDETITIASEYEDATDETSAAAGAARDGNWSPRDDHGTEAHHRIHLVHGSEGENANAIAAQTSSSPQASAPSLLAWNLGGADIRHIPISPRDRIASLPGRYVDSFGPEYVEDFNSQVPLPAVSAASDDSPSNLPGDTPSSWGAISQKQDAASQALLSMRYHDLDTSQPPVDHSQTAPGLLTSKEEADLLRQFSAEVATWMDLSDLSETFSKKVCRLATYIPLLKAASIACAAKQRYLVGKMEDGMQIARKNYDIAISLLINRLRNWDEQFSGYGFAAIVICSCYEMLDAPTADWQRHLDGVFSFGRVQRVNGSSGGISQAAFWSIARQEVVSAIINRSKLRFDPDFWDAGLESIGQEGSEDLVNNQVLTILAKVVDFIASSEVYTPAKRITEWHKLHNLLEYWDNSVNNKGFMDPISVVDEEGKVFQTIWFARSVCANSWQMFHLAQILLLATNPSQDSNCLLAFRKIEAKLLYHARQICGIAQSKPDGSCRVNSVQPIYYAGCCFSREDERKGAVTLLEDIEIELGWASIYRARDLLAL